MRMELCSHFSEGKTGTLRVNKPERSKTRTDTRSDSGQRAFS